MNGGVLNGPARKFGGAVWPSTGSFWAGNTSTPSIVYELTLLVSTFSVAPSGTANWFVTTGMPGVPGAPGESVSGATSLVQDWPPPLSGTNRRTGNSIRTSRPFSSLFSTVVLVSLSVLWRTPPPHRLVRESASSFWLALTDSGPRRESLSAAPLKRLPFLILIVRRTRR